MGKLSQVRTADQTGPAGHGPAAWCLRACVRLQGWLEAVQSRLDKGGHIGSDRFEAVVRLSGGWYWESDADHHLTCLMSSHTGPRDGVAQGDAAGPWTLSQRGPADDWLRTHLQGGAQAQPFRHLPMQGRPTGGRLHYWLISGDPVFDLHGQFSGFRGVARDVTAQEEAERALNVSESQLAAVIDSAKDAMITVDANHQVVMFNRAAGALFGSTRADALGAPLERFIPSGLLAMAPPAPTGDEPARQSNRAFAHMAQVAAVHANGREVQVEATLSQVMVNGHELISVVLRDVSERQQAEKARAALETQLRESQKMEALGTMAGGIAHDFNNIVAAILGNASLARTHHANAELARVFIDEISKAGLRARDLVQRIMSFSRRQPAVFSCQALQPLIEETVQLLRATLPSGIEIRHRMAADTLYAEADATQISQVLMNLGTNAWQALGSHPGCISIVLESAGDAEVRLAVSDNGCGMDEATRQRIFEPFFTTKAKGEGTGLGLPVVHGIVRAHRGRIEVRSQKGEGTTFEIYLPRASAGASGTHALKAQAPHVPGQGQHVVYLDDYPAMVFMMNATLEAEGYRVTGFEDAAKALDFIRLHLHDVDLVVTDFNMPGRSGLEVAREVRQMRPDLPVIVASGYITDELREGATRAGVTQLFDKPRGIDEMCDMIGDVLGHLPQPRSPHERPSHG